MANLTIPDKTTGQQHFATEYQAVKDWINSPLKPLGPFMPGSDIDFSTQGYYDPHIMTGDETWNFTNIIDGITQWIKVTTDGTHTLTINTNGEIFIGSAGRLKEGTYKIGLGTPFGDGIVQVIVPGTEIATQLSTPVITASSQDSAIRIVWSSEDLNATARELLRSTVNDVQTASSVVGYDGTADYVDDNNGSGLTNGATYYYWGRNTAPGLTSSAYATDSAAPSAGVTQLTQPTGLVATGGNNTVALTYDAIDANADDVAVQRSLTSGSGFATIATISRALTSYDDNTAVNGTTYYYRLIANGSGSYSNSNPSAEASATPVDSSIYAVSHQYLGSYIDLPTNSGFDASDGVSSDNPLSFSFWIKPSNTNSNGLSICTIFSKTSGTNAQGLSYECRYYQDNQRIFFYLQSGSTGQLRYISATNSVPVNTWTHVTIIYTGSGSHIGITCYINNSLDTPVTNDEIGTYTISNDVGDVRICKSYDSLNGNPFEISYISFHTEAIGSTIIGELYNSGVQVNDTLSLIGVTTNVLALYDFQNTLADSTANSLDGSGTGTITYSSV